MLSPSQVYLLGMRALFTKAEETKRKSFGEESAKAKDDKIKSTDTSLKIITPPLPPPLAGQALPSRRGMQT